MAASYRSVGGRVTAYSSHRQRRLARNTGIALPSYRTAAYFELLLCSAQILRTENQDTHVSSEIITFLAWRVAIQRASILSVLYTHGSITWVRWDERPPWQKPMVILYDDPTTACDTCGLWHTIKCWIMHYTGSTTPACQRIISIILNNLSV